jgi:conjugal transfer/entry exclusion protein
MSLFDKMMPDLSKVGEMAKSFIDSANGKMDAQTAAIQFLAQQIKVQNETLKILAEKIGNLPASAPTAAGDTAIVSGMGEQFDAGGTGDLARGDGSGTDHSIAAE